MKSNLYAILALFCYAISNFILDRKLKSISPVLNTFLMCSVIAALCLITLMFGFWNKNDLVKLQELDTRKALLVMSIVFFAADLFYLGAYNSGGSMITIATIISLFPVVLLIVEFVAGENTPSIRQCVGVVVGVIAVYLVSGK